VLIIFLASQTELYCLIGVYINRGQIACIFLSILHIAFLSNTSAKPAQEKCAEPLVMDEFEESAAAESKNHYLDFRHLKAIRNYFVDSKRIAELKAKKNADKSPGDNSGSQFPMSLASSQLGALMTAHPQGGVPTRDVAVALSLRLVQNHSAYSSASLAGHPRVCNRPGKTRISLIFGVFLSYLNCRTV